VTAALSFHRSAIPTALASNSPVLLDYADMRTPDDLWTGASICQPNPPSDLRAAKREAVLEQQNGPSIPLMRIADKAGA
jgi:hypothetical protein